MVRCKMVCQSKTETAHGKESGYAITLTPVSDGSAENKEFYKWTPGGKLELWTVNPAAAEALHVGRSYYVDLTETE